MFSFFFYKPIGNQWETDGELFLVNQSNQWVMVYEEQFHIGLTSLPRARGTFREHLSADYLRSHPPPYRLALHRCAAHYSAAPITAAAL